MEVCAKLYFCKYECVRVCMCAYNLYSRYWFSLVFYVCVCVSQAEPEPFEETDVDRLMSSLGFGGSHHVKGHSDSSTLSSQPSIDEVRQQMHLLLDNAFGLASAEPSGRSHHQHHSRHGPHPPYPPTQSGPYADGVTSAPGTMDHPAGALQRGPSFEPDMHQCSLPKPVRPHCPHLHFQVNTIF